MYFIFVMRKNREILGFFFREWPTKSFPREINRFFLYILEFWPQKQKILISNMTHSFWCTAHG